MTDSIEDTGKVIQADRDAAAELAGDYLKTVDKQAVTDGEADNNVFVQAFARARLKNASTKQPEEIVVREIESEFIDYREEPCVPFWRIDIGIHKANFGDRNDANNFCDAINARIAAACSGAAIEAQLPLSKDQADREML